MTLTDCRVRRLWPLVRSVGPGPLRDYPLLTLALDTAADETSPMLAGCPPCP